MSTFYSTQMTNILATPPAKEEAHESNKLHVKYFNYSTPASGAPGTSDTVQLIKVPAGARLLGGKIVSEAMSSAGGTAGISIGDGTTAAKYLSAGNIDSAAQVEFGHTVALYYGEKLSAELTLTATPTGETWAVSKALHGEVRYLK